MVFYAGALLFRQNPADLYDITLQASAQKSATGLEISSRDIDFLPFPYPAIVALAFVPFTFLNYHAAYFLMMLFNFLLIGISMWLLSTRLSLGKYQNRILVLCAFASLSVYSVLVQGQLSFLIFLLCVLLVTDLRDGRERAGIWAGLLAFKPIVIPVWLFWLAVRKRWRALAYAISIVVAIALISFLLVGLEGTLGYIQLLRRLLRGDFLAAHPTKMATLKGLTSFFKLHDFVWIGAVAAVLTGVWKIRASNDWQYCAVIVASILIAPYMHLQELVLLLIPVALILGRSGKNPSAGLRWSLFGLMLWQSLIQFKIGSLDGNSWPMMSLTMGCLFIFFLYLGARTGQPLSK